MNLVIVQSKLG